MSSWRPLLLVVTGAAASPLPSSLWRPLARIRREYDGQPRPPPASQLNGLPRRLAYRALHCFAVGEVMHDKVAVFMVGLPGAGKSRVIDLRYVTDHRNGCRKVNSTCIVDLDREIAEHPQYDAADPDKLYLARGQDAYRWADARVEQRFLNGLADPRVRRLVVDGTGTNVERQVRRMKQARQAGFFVKALYVRVPARTAIVRAAMRKRGVSPQRIYSYQAKMARAMEAAFQHADEVEIVDTTFDDHPLPGTMHGQIDPITAIVF